MTAEWVTVSELDSPLYPNFYSSAWTFMEFRVRLIGSGFYENVGYADSAPCNST